MATKKEYRMVDGKIQRLDIETDENNQYPETKLEVMDSPEEIELKILKLKEKELIQRIETERKISGLVFPLTILAWVVIVSLIINILLVFTYM